MADLMHELPFSWRERRDESAVSSDWRGALAEVLNATAELIDRHVDRHPDAGSRPDEWSGPFLSSARITTPPDAGTGTGTGTAAIRASALALATGRRVSIKQLDRAVYAYLDVCVKLDATPELDPTTSGAVALARAVAAPTPIRAVIAGHSLHATDAGWTFGHGPELQATAVDLLTFLAGRSLQAPSPGHGRIADPGPPGL